MLKNRFERDSLGKQFVTLDRKVYESADAFFEKFYLPKVSIPQRDGASKAMEKFPVLLMPHTTCGSNLWWAAPAFIQAWSLFPKGESVGHGIHNHRWGRWGKLANRTELDPRCLRKPAVTGHLAEGHVEANNLERLWDVPSLATHMLLRVLVQWAFAKNGCGGLSSQERKGNSQDALASLVRVCREKECVMFISPTAVWHPPRRPGADVGLLVDCVNERMDFKALLAAFPHWLALKAVEGAESFHYDESGQVSILVLLAAAEEAGAKAEPFLNQLVWGMGTAIENVLVPELLRKEATGPREEAQKPLGDSPEAGSHKPDEEQPAPCPSSVAASAPCLKQELEQAAPSQAGATYRTEASSECFENSAQKIEKYLDSYHRGAQTIFHNQRLLSISIDGSRIARKALLLAAMARPGGEAAWAPPQISSDYIGEVALSNILGDGDDALEDAKQAGRWGLAKFLRNELFFLETHVNPTIFVSCIAKIDNLRYCSPHQGDMQSRGAKLGQGRQYYIVSRVEGGPSGHWVKGSGAACRVKRSEVNQEDLATHAGRRPKYEKC